MWAHRLLLALLVLGPIACTKRAKRDDLPSSSATPTPTEPTTSALDEPNVLGRTKKKADAGPSPSASTP